MTYDAIIVGGGPAALSSALYMGRYKRKTAVITDSFGGLAGVAGEVENYPGFARIDGFELIKNMVEQIKNLEDIDIEENQKVDSIVRFNNLFKVAAGDKEYHSKGIIICAGMQPRKLGIKGEDALIGKGLSYCATCDGPFSKNKNAVVVGGGRSATESAIDLAKIAQKVTIINIGEALSGEQITLDKLEEGDNITIVNNAETKDFALDSGFIKAVKYKDKKSGKVKEIPAQIVFVEIGQIPNSKPFEKLVKINKKKEIIIDHKTNKTSEPGVYASGDITDITFKQIVIAAGEGAKAAMSLNRYLESE